MLFVKSHIKFHSVLQAFLSACAVSIVGQMSSRSLVPALVLPALILLFYSVYGFFGHSAAAGGSAFSKDHEIVSFDLVSLLFAAFFCTYGRTRYTGNFCSPLFRGAALGIVFAGMFLLVRVLLLLLFSLWLSGAKDETAAAPAGSSPKEFVRKHIAGITFVLCVLFDLPYFLYEYPGIISPDGVNQIMQIVGVSPWSNHHPVTHTLVISLFYHLGRLFTADINTAISFYTLFQMLFLAFCGGVAMQTIRQFTQRLRVLIPCILFFSVLPFMNVFSVYVLKDSFFSGVFLLFCCSLLQLLQDRGESVRKNIIAWIVFGILSFSICLLRSNGWYAFLVMTPFLIAGMKGQRKKLLLTILPVILLAGILRGPVMRAAGVIQPDTIESLCVPLQQVSRVLADKKEISKEQKELLSRVIDLDAVPSLYNAGFADNMKELVRAGHEEYLDEHKAQFFRLWLDLGRRYPGTYLCALADLTEGYWFPENNYETVTIDGVFGNDIGLSWQPKLGGPFVKFKEISLKLGNFVPVYSLLWSAGTYTWLLIICAALLFEMNRTRTAGQKGLLLFLPSFALLLTLFIAVPSASEFRYELPVVLVSPLFIVYTCKGGIPCGYSLKK